MDILIKINGVLNEEKTLVVTKPNKEKFIYTDNKNSQYHYDLQKAMPGLKIVTHASSIPMQVWSNPEAEGWKLETIKHFNS